jgi:DNA replication ATP-dependent helicase Dna2
MVQKNVENPLRMPPTAAQEADFMNDLLAGLDQDDSFWNAVPTPDTTPVKPSPSFAKQSRSRPPITPNKPQNSIAKQKPVTPGDVDMAALLEGAEDWDWSDMNSDFISPVKKTTTIPVIQVRPPLFLILNHANLHQPGTPVHVSLPYARCLVESVSEITVNDRLQKVGTHFSSRIFLLNHWL